MWSPFGPRPPHLTLGRQGAGPFSRPYKLPLSETASHVHVQGLSGVGKSRFLAGFFLELLKSGLPATVVDPHGDLYRLLLASLVDSGLLDDPKVRERILFLDLPAADKIGWYLPFNVLAAPNDPHTISRQVVEAMRRVWPSLEGGVAPTFENLMVASSFVLASHRLDLTLIHDLLTDKEWRDRLLTEVGDETVRRFFAERHDRWRREQALMIESTLRRVFLLAFSPVLRYSLAQPDNLFDFGRIMAEGRSLVVNLALDDGDARRLLGSLLAVGAEQAALARASLPPEERGPAYHLILDEFFEFSAQSGETLARILSLTRKYGLSLVMAHQTYSQLGTRVQGALQNAGLEVIFRLGRADAEASTGILGHADPLAVKHEVADSAASERTHPLYYGLAEQREEWTRRVAALPAREAFVRRPTGKVARIRTLAVPDVAVDPDKLAWVEADYLRRYFRPKEEIEAEMESRRRATSPTVSRTVERKHDERR